MIRQGWGSGEPGTAGCDCLLAVVCGLMVMGQLKLQKCHMFWLLMMDGDDDAGWCVHASHGRNVHNACGRKDLTD